MVLDLVPTAKTVGMLYCSAEANSDYQVKEVAKYLQNKGITVKNYKFSGSEDVAQVTEAAAAECDAIYVPTDNTAASCAQTIGGIVTNKKVPVIAGEAGICKGCGIATLSISYEELGRTTGAMAVKILKGESKIEEMPIEYDTKPVKKYNKTFCDLLGITPPEGYEALS
jgi:putative ABC transport system substrate-binding protein